MSGLRHALLLLLAAMAAALPAHAAELLRRVPASLDPTKGYVLVEIRNQDGLRLPGSLVLARYDPAGGDVRGGARSPGSAVPHGEAVRIAVSSKELEKAHDSRLYLLALEPDIWVIEGAGGTAFSLDSRSFTIAAGQILDLGVLSPRTDWPEGESAPRLTVGRLAGMALLGPFAHAPDPRPAMLDFRARGDGDLLVPAPLRAAIAPAQLQPGARFGNYLGGLVNRIDGRRGRPDPAAAPVPASELELNSQPALAPTPAPAPEPAAAPTPAPEAARVQP